MAQPNRHVLVPTPCVHGRPSLSRIHGLSLGTQSACESTGASIGDWVGTASPCCCGTCRHKARATGAACRSIAAQIQVKRPQGATVLKGALVSCTESTTEDMHGSVNDGGSVQGQWRGLTRAPTGSLARGEEAVSWADQLPAATVVLGCDGGGTHIQGRSPWAGGRSGLPALPLLGHHWQDASSTHRARGSRRGQPRVSSVVSWPWAWPWRSRV